ncbi:MAG TPA: GAF domain-containing SpoIIE family protein phosphatase [Bacteroidota bacterium]|nr:GAF domain-containing SpoIIE family protein phosphatase [Bacteroidota bacterium]
MTRLTRILLIGTPVILLPLIYIHDVIRVMVELDISVVNFLRELFIFAAYISLGFFIDNRRRHLKQGLPKEIGRLLIAVVLLELFLAGCSRFLPENFNGAGLKHAAFGTLVLTIAVIASSVIATVELFIVRDLLFFKKNKTAKRNYRLYLAMLSAACVITLPMFSLGDTWASKILFALAVIMIIAISFRQSWIVYLSKREKIYTIIYSGFLFLALIGMEVFFSQSATVGEFLSQYSEPLHTFIKLNNTLGIVYFGITGITTLFHLPTTDVFERKQSELHSLHNLSRLATQVFDFQELVNTVAQMTTEVCDARSVWLELLTTDEITGVMSIDVAVRKNITQTEIDALTNENEHVRSLLLDTHKTLLIDDIWSDRRTKHLKAKGVLRSSLMMAPLVSHQKLIGVLYATKEVENAFDQDDIDVMTTFADNVSIAIENSRLIARSLERERLHQEMMVAQRMQKRLLPQSLPVLPQVQLAASSESSFEVGGDYYDIFPLADNNYGIIIGDVSGKGVSAAFYMAEVKGIFLSLSQLCSTPRELLLRANRSLLESLEKNAFISVIYSVLDVSNATLTLARAGHCPAVFLSEEHSELIRSTGLGLGLATDEIFSNATEERCLPLKPNDVCLLYTDGIVEARNSEGEEFGYERLLQAAQQCKHLPAEEIKEAVLSSVRTFLGVNPYNDDVTLVVVKWLGT